MTLYTPMCQRQPLLIFETLQRLLFRPNRGAQVHVYF